MVGLAVDGTSRSPLFPDIPTVAELGYREPMLRQYFSMVAPKGTPPEIIARLREDVAAAMNDPVFRTQMIERSVEPIADTTEHFAQFLREDRNASERVVKAAGIEPQ